MFGRKKKNKSKKTSAAMCYLNSLWPFKEKKKTRITFSYFLLITELNNFVMLKNYCLLFLTRL